MKEALLLYKRDISGDKIVIWQNYVTTKTFDDKDILIGYYWDITSQVTRMGSDFEFYDWYLGV